jgi:hypothetical protein
MSQKGRFSKWMKLALALLCIPPITSCNCTSTTPGQVCFTLSPPGCTLAPGAQFCMGENSCQGVYGYDEIIYNYYRGNPSLQCTTQLGQTYQAETVLLYSGSKISGSCTVSYYDLYYFEYGYYPTPSQLASMTPEDAAFFLAMYVMVMDLPGVTGTETSETLTANMGQLCFPKWTNACYHDPGDQIGEIGPAFQGYVVFPDGDTCKTQDVSFTDQVGPDPCGNSNTTVKLLPGCADCN